MTSHQILNKHTIIDVFCSPSMQDCSEKYILAKQINNSIYIYRTLEALLSFTIYLSTKWKPIITNVPGAPLTVLIAAFCEDNNSSSSLWAVGSICLINYFKSLAKIHLCYKHFFLQLQKLLERFPSN
jgi:hypothetical protein